MAGFVQSCKSKVPPRPQSYISKVSGDIRNATLKSREKVSGDFRVATLNVSRDLRVATLNSLEILELQL